MKNPEHEEEFPGLENLMADLDALTPTPEREFGKRLDRRVQDGFPRLRPMRPKPAPVPDDGLRRMLAPVFAGVVMIVLAVLLIGGPDSAPLPGEISDEVASVEEAPVAESTATESASRDDKTSRADSGNDVLLYSGSANREKPANERLNSEQSYPQTAAPPAATASGSSTADQAAEDARLLVPMGVRQARAAAGRSGNVKNQPSPAKVQPDAGVAAATTPATPVDRDSQSGFGNNALPLALIAAGLLLLIPVAWVSTATLRKQRQERALDW